MNVIKSMINVYALFTKIEQKGMTFDHNFCYSFSFSSSLCFLGGKRKGEKNNQSRGQNSYLSARSYLQIILKVFQISLKNDQKFGQVLSRKKNIVQFFSTHRVFHSWLFYSSDPKKDPCSKNIDTARCLKKDQNIGS
jgi:hypothetical protein